MASQPTSPDLWGFFAALVISLASGFISISRRVLGGHQGTALWVVSEFCTAILCGYLMYNAYPVLENILPDWVTLPVAVAVAAHSGGRIFQEAEATLIDYATRLFNRP